ncbi:TonB family protein [Pendulispora brunnea]|uniref:TonB family protein n=1 Tax=Pendulispora brunnea TaxID=2905690 RepID=UPI00374E1CDE
MTRPRLISGSEIIFFPDWVIPTLPAEVYLVARCVLRKEGSVTDCKMVCSHPGLDETVLENLRQRRYMPATTSEGDPVDVTYTFQFQVMGP